MFAVTMAKGVGNGFPLGVCVTTPGESKKSRMAHAIDCVRMCVCVV